MAAVVIDGGAVQVGLVSIAISLNVTPAEAIHVVSAYQLAVLMALLPCAHLAERFGTRRLFRAGLITFGIASVACATARTLPFLVTARFVEGLGGGAILALGIALLREALGTERVTQAITWNALTVALSAATAPVFGGFVLSVAGWPWLFLFNVPIAGASLLGSAAFAPSKRTRSDVAILSIFLTAVTCAAAMLAVAFAFTRPSAATALLIASLGCGLWLFRKERRTIDPVVPWDLLAKPEFRRSVIASILSFTAVSTGLIAIPLQLQSIEGRSPNLTGLIMASWPLAAATTSQFATRLSRNLTAAQLCTSGAIIITLGLAIASCTAIVPSATGMMLLAACVCGAGFGLFQVPNNRTMFFAAPMHRSAAAGGMQGTARLTGQTLGAILVGALLSVLASSADPYSIFTVASLFSGAAAALSAIGFRRRAAATS